MMMTPSTTGGKKRGGNLRFDLVFPAPVGRVWTSSGTKNPKMFRKLEALLEDLWQNGQHAALQAIQAGMPPQLFLQPMREGKLASATLLADVKLRDRLFDLLDEDDRVLDKGAATRTIDAMVGTKGKPLAESSKERYRLSFRQLRDLADTKLTEASTVGDLREVPWAKVFAAWETSGANKNRLRAAVSAFLSDYLGDVYHPFRREIAKAMPRSEERKRLTDLETPVFWQLMAKVPDPARPAFITLAASGMRVGEFLQCGEHDLIPARFAIHIPGGKTGEDEAFVEPELWEYVPLAIPCRVAKPPKKWRGVQRDARYKKLRALLKAAAAKLDPPISVTIHDLRHLYAQLGVEEMPESMVQAAMRHKTPAMTRDYSMRKVKGEVARSVGRQLRRAK